MVFKKPRVGDFVEGNIAEKGEKGKEGRSC